MTLVLPLWKSEITKFSNSQRSLIVIDFFFKKKVGNDSSLLFADGLKKIFGKNTLPELWLIPMPVHGEPPLSTKNLITI